MVGANIELMEEVEGFVLSRKQALEEAIQTGTLPSPTPDSCATTANSINPAPTLLRAPKGHLEKGHLCLSNFKKLLASKSRGVSRWTDRQVQEKPTHP
jgi:hypothetical protein